MGSFYDQLSPYYHLIFHDNMNAAIERQSNRLADVIGDMWGGNVRSILDVSCGIGTQAIGLAMKGFDVTASDLSEGAILRAEKEAEKRGVSIDFSVADMRYVHEKNTSLFDLVISCDNSVPHLLSDEDILQAFRSFYSCTRPGGGCLISVRDYNAEERGQGIIKSYGIREVDNYKYFLFQVWDFNGDLYDLSFYIVEEDMKTMSVKTHKMCTRYYAVRCDRLEDLMKQAGFVSVKRLDVEFYQPIIVGTKRRGRN